MSPEELLMSGVYQKLNGSGSATIADLTSNGGGNTAASNNGGGMLVEDFCELCNKQFCNKYYLKVRF